MKKKIILQSIVMVFINIAFCGGAAIGKPIQHDAEHYVLLEQHSKGMK